HVIGGDAGGRVAVAGLDRAYQVAVLAQRLRPAARAGQRGSRVPGHVAVHPGKKIDQGDIVAGRPDFPVECPVGRRHRVRISGIDRRCGRRGEAEPDQLQPGVAPGRVPRRGGLQQDAHLVDLQDLLRAPDADAKAASPALHQPVLLQPAQRLTNRGAAGPVPRGNRRFHQRRALWQLSRDDLVAEALVHVHRQSLPASIPRRSLDATVYPCIVWFCFWTPNRMRTRCGQGATTCPLPTTVTPPGDTVRPRARSCSLSTPTVTPSRTATFLSKMACRTTARRLTRELFKI